MCGLGVVKLEMPSNSKPFELPVGCALHLFKRPVEVDVRT